MYMCVCTYGKSGMECGGDVDYGILACDQLLCCETTDHRSYYMLFILFIFFSTFLFLKKNDVRLVS